MDIHAEKISDAEAEIMRVVWDHRDPVTYACIRTALKQKGWESPTVNTLVSRLVKKGVLRQEKKEVYYYSAVISREEYTQARTEVFVKKVYGGNVKGLITALLSSEDITQEELDELHRQWRESGKKKER